MKLNSSVSILALAVAAGLASAGCSSPEQSDDPLGALGIELQVAPGVTLGTMTYTITGPTSNAVAKMGTINVASSTKLMATIAAIPASTGYAIAVSGTASDGVTICGGSASFAISAKTTTAVSIHLLCKEPPKSGTAMVNGTVNVCPLIDTISSNPAQVDVGSTVALSATAHDHDAGPSPLAYHWEASSGTLAGASGASTTFTCTAEGPATITLRLSDGDPDPSCADALSVTVACTVPMP